MFYADFRLVPLGFLLLRYPDYTTPLTTAHVSSDLFINNIPFTYGESMGIITKRYIKMEDEENLDKEMKKLFKSEDMEFAEKIALKIVEMVKNGQKVYLTDQAAKLLEPILEKHGIVWCQQKE